MTHSQADCEVRPACARRSLLAFCCALAVVLVTGCQSIKLAAEKIPPLPTPANLRKAEKQRYSLARLSENKGSMHEARHIYNKIVAKNPKHQNAWHRLAIVASKEGKWAEAEQFYTRALGCGPKTPELLSDMAYTLYLQHRLTEAEALLHESLAIEPHHVASINNLALVLGEQGRFQESLQAFRQVNTEAEAEANLAYVLTQLGHHALAQDHYNRALSLDNNMRPAAVALLELAQREGRGHPVASSPKSHDRPGQQNAGIAGQQNAAVAAPPFVAPAGTTNVGTVPQQYAAVPYGPPTPMPIQAGMVMGPPQLPAVQPIVNVGGVPTPQPAVVAAAGSSPYSGQQLNGAQQNGVPLNSAQMNGAPLNGSQPGMAQQTNYLQPAANSPQPSTNMPPVYPQASPTVQPYQAGVRQ